MPGLRPAVVCLAVCLAACSYTKDTYRHVKSYVDPDPKVAYDNYRVEDENERTLAALFTPVDENLSSLMRYLNDQESLPTPEWLDLGMLRFPWIDGLMVLDGSGKILARLPEVRLKPFTPWLLVEHEGAWLDRRTKAFIEETELGPEMHLGRPFFKDTHFDGLIVASLDPRTLLNFTPDPKALIILQPQTQSFWTDGDATDKSALLGQDWEGILKERIGGFLDVNGRQYTWLSRFVGNMRFIYLTLSRIPVTEKRFFFF